MVTDEGIIGPWNEHAEAREQPKEGRKRGLMCTCWRTYTVHRPRVRGMLFLFLLIRAKSRKRGL